MTYKDEILTPFISETEESETPKKETEEEEEESSE